MNTIPLITSDTELFETVREFVVPEDDGFDGVHLLSNPDDAIEYLNLEMPSLLVIDFSSTFDAYGVLDKIMTDPWLLHGGIIALSNDRDDLERLEEVRGANVVAILTRPRLTQELPRVLSIISRNRRLLIQREVGTDLVRDLSGSFQLENDPLEATCYLNLICNLLHNSNKIGADKKNQLRLCLDEMLNNAIEHGNCGITHEQKSAWLEDGKWVSDLVKERCADPKIAKRRVTLEYVATPTSSRFFVADEGDGFDWRALRARDADPLKSHGRGISMTEVFAKNLTYNEKGNEVRFEFENQQDEATTTPAVFEHIEPRDVIEDEVIYAQGESSDFLYYIVKGRFDVSVNGKSVATLSPNDLLMGEMSFLLNKHRSATVRAQSVGRLIEISRKRFVEAIRRKPHYALLLCRLLAQRLQRTSAILSG